MDAATLTLHPTDAEALDYIRDLLAANDLPTDDLPTDDPASSDARFYIATRGGSRVGIGGIEPAGDAGLLRSVVVDASARGEGVGTALCGALEDAARDTGIETLYLLTTTASGFFADRGYEPVDRELAPDGIQATAEFDALCPSSATCMRKPLRE